MTTTTHEKAHGCDPVGFQNDTTNELNFPTAEREGKAFARLAANFALAGHCLHRTDSKDGPVCYYAQRWGLVRHLPTLDAAQRFLMQIGGTP